MKFKMKMSKLLNNNFLRRTLILFFILTLFSCKDESKISWNYTFGKIEVSGDRERVYYKVNGEKYGYYNSHSNYTWFYDGEKLLIAYDSLDPGYEKVFHGIPVIDKLADYDSTSGRILERSFVGVWRLNGELIHNYVEFEYTVGNKTFKKIQVIKKEVKTEKNKKYTVLYNKKNTRFAYLVLSDSIPFIWDQHFRR